mmetsp:Transcript_482/g.819  ORF Transcript_482/g.819 Transcript_482/m.819 type:complete len:615 (-) Transcript_482:58-1902(-)
MKTAFVSTLVQGIATRFGDLRERDQIFNVCRQTKEFDKADRSIITRRSWRGERLRLRSFQSTLQPPPQHAFSLRAEMFDGISRRLGETLRSVKDKTLSSKDEWLPVLKKIRDALLDADVDVDIAVRFVTAVKARFNKARVPPGVTPDQVLVKAVYDELVATMSSEDQGLRIAEESPSVIMLMGMQGVGKTTHAIGLAMHLRSHYSARAMIVASDWRRPASQTQVQKMCERLGVPVYIPDPDMELNPHEIAWTALNEAREAGVEYVIVDTAGCVPDNTLKLQEIVEMRDSFGSHMAELLLVVDAAMGQDAAEKTREFHEAVGITGAILSRLDGDTRGGAALTVKKISERPIKFVGIGEGPNDLIPFEPEKLATRIMGMGDVITLVEKAQAAAEENPDMASVLDKLLHGKYDFNDFLTQLRFFRRLGSMQSILSMIPTSQTISPFQVRDTDAKLLQYETIIMAMTAQERSTPDFLYAADDEVDIDLDLEQILLSALDGSEATSMDEDEFPEGDETSEMDVQSRLEKILDDAVAAGVRGIEKTFADDADDDEPDWDERRERIAEDAGVEREVVDVMLEEFDRTRTEVPDMFRKEEGEGVDLEKITAALSGKGLSSIK